MIAVVVVGRRVAVVLIAGGHLGDVGVVPAGKHHGIEGQIDGLTAVQLVDVPGQRRRTAVVCRDGGPSGSGVRTDAPRSVRVAVRDHVFDRDVGGAVRSGVGERHREGDRVPHVGG